MKKTKERLTNFFLAFVIILIPILSLIFYMFFFETKNNDIIDLQNKNANNIVKPIVKKDNIKKPSSDKIITTVTKKYKIAFVIDDCGNSVKEVENFLKIKSPITFAIFPDAQDTQKVVNLLKNKDIIIHQPMEAKNFSNIGNGGIYINMKDEEITKVLKNNFDSLKYAIGINNHTGSAVTEDERVMNVVFDFLKEKNLFFLDSKTTPNSVCKKIAKEKKVKFIERNALFLDNKKDRASILSMLNEGKDFAKKNGYAVLIGHANSSELAKIIKEEENNLKSEYEIVALKKFFE